MLNSENTPEQWQANIYPYPAAVKERLRSLYHTFPQYIILAWRKPLKKLLKAPSIL
jgi:hypothetical protein